MKQRTLTSSGTPEAVRLIIADDHILFREGCISLIQSQSPQMIDIVGVADNGEDAWKIISELHPDIAILDISMPKRTGLEVAELTRKKGLNTRIVMLTMFIDPSLAIHAMQLGVGAYVVKDNSFDELINAIQKVSVGKTYISPMVEKNIFGFNKKTLLSKQELSVLELIAKGMTNKKIAIELAVSPKTVETYKSRLMTKLELHNIAELTQHAMKIGLVPMS